MVKAKKYSETTNNQIYQQGLLTFKLSDGKYKLKPSLTLDNTDIEIQIKPIDLVVDSKQIYKPIYVEHKELGEYFSLVNFQNSILFSANKYDMLIPCYDSSISQIHIKVTQNDKNIIEQNLVDKIELDEKFTKKNNDIVLLNKSHNKKLNYFFINNIGKALIEGEIKIQILLKDLNISYTSNVLWKDKPNSLHNVEEAIEFLSLIGYKRSADSLLNFPENKQYAALYGFWKNLDTDTSSAYSDIFNEFYTRIDFINREFNSLGKNDGMDTDRGKVYLIFGKPDSIERKFNNVYDVLEIWDYKSINKKIFFSDKTGTGKFERIK